MKKPYAVTALILFAILIAGTLFFFLKKEDSVSNIKSFEDCAEAGYPILESYPEQCRTPDGRTFVKLVSQVPSPSPSTNKADLIVVTSPVQNEAIQSPVTITGKARGFWFFEGSFPIKIVDANGKTLGSGIAQAEEDWMTENFVSFKATVNFSSPSTERGKIVLEKDNPSGLPEHDDKLELPIAFSKETPLKTVKLYYYDESRDKDLNGNILCSSKGLVEVSRKVPISLTPIQDAVKLLIKGELLTLEKAKGLETEFPLPGLSLNGASLKNGVLTLSWNDPENKTSGGSCRVGVLFAQIEATVKQFPEVKSVKMEPTATFQP